jgi:hypothetical protein
MFQLLLPRARALYVSLCDGRHYMLRQVRLLGQVVTKPGGGLTNHRVVM